MVIVFTNSINISNTAKGTISPAINIALGALILLITYVLSSGRSERVETAREKRREKKAEKKATKGPPKWERYLSAATMRRTFVLGMLLTLPGVSYLTALVKMDTLNLSTAETVLSVIGFNLIMLTLMEVPLLGYVFNPEGTDRTIKKFRNWLRERGGTIVKIAAILLGVGLILRGVLSLVT
jgi:hypothetical protein